MIATRHEFGPNRGCRFCHRCTVAMKWLVDEDGSEAAFALRDRDLVAPALLRIEAANVLRALVARQATTADEALDLFALLQDAPVTIVDHDEALERRVLHLGLELATSL